MRPFLALSLVAVVMTGCAFAVVPEWRDQEYQARLQAQPKEIQELIKQNEVRSGMTREQVLLSWGKPGMKVKGSTPATEHMEGWLYFANYNRSPFKRKGLYLDTDKLISIDGQEESDKPVCIFNRD